MHRRTSLLEAGVVVRHPELLLAPDRCDKVSCDDTGRCPVLRGGGSSDQGGTVPPVSQVGV